ncbi:uncharacterized protein MONBRDRAFT_25174 [Monosiga brevicollis MX1]|uniref:USP domain-containing protein n=1 Tax=Monosiga brevicollis TaxID=81824 RepID=A9UYM1_MONBE|nr:uncharacterized protein MONBRDRAFT_25174 [Monosiga brevicollis MX1]EDQ89628.1 predicted protein [Monosiga brevicollis MX1]|eukprot:XP_001745657.1 hypothetical protein [Monosiga brevicollis MX1]
MTLSPRNANRLALALSLFFFSCEKNVSLSLSLSLWYHIHRDAGCPQQGWSPLMRYLAPRAALPLHMLLGLDPRRQLPRASRSHRLSENGYGGVSLPGIALPARPPAAPAARPPTYPRQDSLPSVHVASNRSPLQRRRGLRNLGNTCYMNACLQCLYHLPAFRQSVLAASPLGDRHGLLQAVQRTFEQLGTPNPQAVAPFALQHAAARANDMFVGYEQHDAEELLRTILFALHDATKTPSATPPAGQAPVPVMVGFEQLLRRHRQLEPGPMLPHFEGWTRSTVTCRSCGHRSATFEPFVDLSLDLPALASPPTTEACLACYTQPEDLAGDHRILCDACHKNQPVTKQVALELLPPILIVHFKRFQHTGHVSRKLTTPVTLTGSELNLAPFLSGSLFGGHYTAQCLDLRTNAWCDFNDATARLCTAPATCVCVCVCLVFFLSSLACSLTFPLCVCVGVCACLLTAVAAAGGAAGAVATAANTSKVSPPPPLVPREGLARLILLKPKLLEPAATAASSPAPLTQQILTVPATELITDIHKELTSTKALSSKPAVVTNAVASCWALVTHHQLSFEDLEANLNSGVLDWMLRDVQAPESPPKPDATILLQAYFPALLRLDAQGSSSNTAADEELISQALECMLCKPPPVVKLYPKSSPETEAIKPAARMALRLARHHLKTHNDGKARHVAQAILPHIAKSAEGLLSSFQAIMRATRESTDHKSAESPHVAAHTTPKRAKQEQLGQATTMTRQKGHKLFEQPPKAGQMAPPKLVNGVGERLLSTIDAQLCCNTPPLRHVGSMNLPHILRTNRTKQLAQELFDALLQPATLFWALVVAQYVWPIPFKQLVDLMGQVAGTPFSTASFVLEFQTHGVLLRSGTLAELVLHQFPALQHFEPAMNISSLRDTELLGSENAASTAALYELEGIAQQLQNILQAQTMFDFQ